MYKKMIISNLYDNVWKLKCMEGIFLTYRELKEYLKTCIDFTPDDIMKV